MTTRSTDKIKRFIDCYIPTETCNLRCHYCYIALQKRFGTKVICFQHSKEEIRKALSKERLGGPCLLNLCAGGETLLSDEVLPIVKELLEEGHYIMLVTNGTVTRRFQEVAQWPRNLLSRLFFKFSFHYLEMVRLNWMDRFFGNVQLMKDCGASFTVEITPSDELIEHIPELKRICMERLGALCHVTIARDDRTGGIDVLSRHNFEEYKRIWAEFDSPLFDYKATIFYKKRKEFCYAGEWSAYLNLDSGRLTQCYHGKQLCNIFENIDSPIPFEPIGCNCSEPHCYNGHSFLALGDIPALDTPTYSQLRDRECTDGSHWLQPEMAAFMSSKLGQSNVRYTPAQKRAIAHKKKTLSLRSKLAEKKFYQTLHKLKERFL